MGKFLEPADLTPFSSIDENKAQAMIADAESMAVLVAPCINSDGFSNFGAVRAILRGAVLRWNDAGTGAIQAQTAGPFGQTIDTRQERRGMFWPSDIEQLQNLCATGSVYTTSLAGTDGDYSRPFFGTFGYEPLRY